MLLNIFVFLFILIAQFYSKINEFSYELNCVLSLIISQ